MKMINRMKRKIAYAVDDTHFFFSQLIKRIRLNLRLYDWFTFVTGFCVGSLLVLFMYLGVWLM